MRIESQMGVGAPLSVLNMTMKDRIVYMRRVVKRLPSLTILRNSFFIKNLRRDFESGFKVILKPMWEKVFMLLPAFIDCILMEVSKGDIRGMGLAKGKKFRLEDVRKMASKAMK